MSVGYIAYPVSSGLIQILEQKGKDAFNLFWSADMADDFEDLEEFAEEAEFDLAILGADAKSIFDEAKNFDDSDKSRIDANGKWAQNLHLVLSGCPSFEMPDFIISQQLDAPIQVSALTGCHAIEDAGMPVFYVCPSEVVEIANILPTFLNEDLAARWERLRSAVNPRDDYFSVDEAQKILQEEFIPLYQDSAECGDGILICLTV
jgi:hypothetical protein